MVKDSLLICEDLLADQNSQPHPKLSLFAYKCDAVTESGIVNINSTSSSHSLCSDLSSISGIILLLLVANAPVHFRKKNLRWWYQQQYNLLPCFCLCLPADWIFLFFFFLCDQTYPVWISNNILVLTRLWLKWIFKKNRLFCCGRN